MSTADAPGCSDGSGGVQKLVPFKRSRGAHRGVLTRRATAIWQAGGALEDVQATLEFLTNRQKLLTELDSQIQQFNEEDDELEADVHEAADVCNGRHHTSLHFDRPVEQQSGVTSGATFSGHSVLLSTAMVGIDDTAGRH